MTGLSEDKQHGFNASAANLLGMAHSSLSYASAILDTILSGHKPFLDPNSETDGWVVDLFKLMERENTIPENWDQFAITPGQNLKRGMIDGVTSMSVLCAPLVRKGKEWEEKLLDAGIRNFHVLGLDPAFRFYGQNVDQANVAQCFVLPEGDFDSLSQFLKVVDHNRKHSSAPKPIVVDNRNGFWNELREQCSESQWAENGVSFVGTMDQAVRFFQAHVDPENLVLDPLVVDHPFLFKEKNPVMFLGTSNLKKIMDFRAVKNKFAPMLSCYPFETVFGKFREPDETSRTYFGNALEKIEAMLDVIYETASSYDALVTKFPDKPLVLIANDTGARLRLVDKEGVEVPVDWVNCPELQKAKHFIAEGKERWWPGAEIKMVSSAMGKSTVFYSTVLKSIRDRVSQEIGKELDFRYIDDSVYVYAVLNGDRENVRLFATKGMHEDGMKFLPSPRDGDIDFENFSLPLNNNPEGGSRTDLGHEALLGDSSTLHGIMSFLETIKFPEPINLHRAFDEKKGKILNMRNIPRRTVGVIGDFSADGRSSGLVDFKRQSHLHGYSRPRGKFNIADAEGFEEYLATLNALILGGADDVDLSPVERAAFYSRVMVAIQTKHPSLSGKPVIVVDDGNMDPVLEWIFETQNFLYNHKLYDVKIDQRFHFVDCLRSGFVAANKALEQYVEPICFSRGYTKDGEDISNRPTVTLFGSAGTYDPQHIGKGENFAIGLAERDLHLRHGGCSRGVVGGAADSFASHRDKIGKGYMTGIQCHTLLRSEGVNDGNDCLKVYDVIGGRKLDLYQSDIAVFLAGGWGTVEEAFDLFAMIDAGRAEPQSVIFVDYPFDAAPNETTFQHIRNFLTPEMMKKYNISFVKSEQEAMQLVDFELPALWRECDSRRAGDMVPKEEPQELKIA